MLTADFIFFNTGNLPGRNNLEKNKLRKVLESGKLAIGSCVYTHSPILVELGGFIGLDFMRIDNEHAWRRDESAENMMRAAAFSNITSMFRVDNDPDVIRKAMEIGAGCLLIPHVNTAKQVKRIVKAAKFPPLGEKGSGPICFSGRWGTANLQDWIKWSNEEILLGIMIEDRRAIPNLDEMLSIKELDYVLFGPGDFSVSLGTPYSRDNPKLMEGIQKTIDAAERHGKYAITVTAFPWADDWVGNAKKFIDMGIHGLEIGHDVTVLGSIWKKMMYDIRDLTK